MYFSSYNNFVLYILVICVSYFDWLKWKTAAECLGIWVCIIDFENCSWLSVARHHPNKQIDGLTVLAILYFELYMYLMVCSCQPGCKENCSRHNTSTSHSYCWTCRPDTNENTQNAAWTSCQNIRYALGFWFQVGITLCGCMKMEILCTFFYF